MSAIDDIRGLKVNTVQGSPLVAVSSEKSHGARIMLRGVQRKMLRHESTDHCDLEYLISSL